MKALALEFYETDTAFQVCVAALLVLGFVAMTSASVAWAENATGSMFHFTKRYVVHFGIALVCAVAVYRMPMSFWQQTGWLWLMLGCLLLTLVLVPGIGHESKGGRRWIVIGPLSLQVSELVKPFVVIYLAGYLVRRRAAVTTSFAGFINPMMVVFFVTLLLMMEPDFGATVMIVATSLALLFLGGARLGQFLLIVASCLAALATLAMIRPYRVQRLVSYLDPWADPTGSGYQITQALIAFGRGEFFGAGLGQSIQKLFFLPEAHTDFVYAIWAEETGFIGAVLVVMLFAALVWRMFKVARTSEAMGKQFGAYVAYGVAILFAGQAFISLGVNTGLLPTKGLTLPLWSYGGSSLLASLSMLALVARIDHEARLEERARG